MPDEEPRCRHGYPLSQNCFTCHVDRSAAVLTNEKGEKVYCAGRAAIEEEKLKSLERVKE